MKTLLSGIFLALFTASIFGASIPGTVVSAPITSGNTANTISIGDSTEMQGTPKSVADSTARDAIPAARRTEGMECFLTSTKEVYKLVGGIDNTNWTRVMTLSPSFTGFSVSNGTDHVDILPTGIYTTGNSTSAVFYGSAAGLTGIPAPAGTATNPITPYVQALAINDQDAINRLEGFARDLDARGLWGYLVDGAALASDLNNTNTLRTFRLAYGTNTTSTAFSLDGALFQKTNHLDFPISVGWSNTMIVDYNGRTNSIGDTFVPWGQYNATTTEKSYGHNMGNDVLRASTAYASGAPYDPVSGLGVWFDDRERVVATVMDNYSTNEVFADGLVCLTNASYYATPGALSGSPTRVVIGMRWNSGSTFDFGAWMSVRSWLVFSKVLSRSEIQAVSEITTRWLHPSTVNDLFIGDSQVGPHTVGSGWTPGLEWATLYEQTYNANRVRWYNWGQSGITAAGWDTAYFLTNCIVPYGRGGRVAAGNAYVLLGVNGIGTSLSPASEYGHITNIYATLRANGYKVNAITQQHVNTNQMAGWTAAMDANLDTLNALILSDKSLYDKVYRRDLMFQWSEIDTNNGLSKDGLHLTPAGDWVMARMVGGDIIPEYQVLTNGGVDLKEGYLTRVAGWNNVGTLDAPAINLNGDTRTSWPTGSGTGSSNITDNAYTVNVRSNMVVAGDFSANTAYFKTLVYTNGSFQTVTVGDLTATNIYGNGLNLTNIQATNIVGSFISLTGSVQVVTPSITLNGSTRTTWPAAGSNPGFDTVQSGANVTATMQVGTGASLAPTGSGTVTANALSGTPATSLAAAMATNDSRSISLSAASNYLGTVVGANAFRLHTTPGVGDGPLMVLATNSQELAIGSTAAFMSNGIIWGLQAANISALGTISAATHFNGYGSAVMPSKILGTDTSTNFVTYDPGPGIGVAAGTIYTTNNTVGTRTFLHDSTHTVITNSAYQASSEWINGTQKEWATNAVTMSFDKLTGTITAIKYNGLPVGGITFGAETPHAGQIGGTPAALYSGTITGWYITCDGVSPTNSFDVWKVAKGTSLPTVANCIGTNLSLTTGNAIFSNSVTNWSSGTNVTKGDMFKVYMNLGTTTGSSNVVFHIDIQP